MRHILITFAATALVVAGAPSFARGGGGGHSSGGHSSGARSSTSSGVHSIRGYTKKNGTYVAPSHATNPNATKRDNFSTKGNVNPYTGKEGTKDANK